MELYKKFLKETCNRECFYDDNGFVTYYINDGTVILDDLYINEESRGNAKRYDYYNFVVNFGKENNCKRISSVINKLSTEETQSRTKHILEKEGFSKHFEDEYMIYFSKEI